MSDFLDWWYEDAGDRRVQRQLQEELDSAYASQAQEASALRSQMSRLTGTLEQRIDRLAKAFDAFVELSDIRAELSLFEPETSVRNAAQRLLSGLLLTPDDPPPLPADLPGCRGYWLRPAPLAAVAVALAEEGSHDEIALRRRARELREVIDSRKTAIRPSWDAAEAATVDLLRKDAFGPDLSSRRLALGIGKVWVTATAAELARAASVPPPEEFQVRIDWHDVTLHTSGQASLSAANVEIEQGNAPQGVTDMLFRRKRLEEETAREQDVLARDASEAAAALAKRAAELREAATQAQSDHAAIVAFLPA